MDLSRTVETNVKRLDVAVLVMALAFAIILWFPDPLYLAILAG